MRVLAVLCLAVVAGVLAQDATTDEPTIAPFTCDGNAFVCKLKELGHHIKFHAKKLGNKLKDVGTSVLSAALDQGKNLLATGGQAVLGTVLEHLNKSGIVGRDVSFFDKIKEHMGKGVAFITKIKEGLKARFDQAVEKITGVLKNTAGLKKVEENADTEIDTAVDDFKKSGKTGFLAMASAIKDRLKGIFSEGVKKLKAIYGKKDDSDEKRAILDTFKGAWNKAKEHFGNIVGGLSDTFKPHLDALKAGVSQLAAKAKEHGSNLLSAAKGHFDTLKGKLSGHLDTLKGHAATLGGHATNALNALKEAVTSIVSQTLGNVQGTIGDAVKTGKDAAGVIGDHVKDAISGN